ncbi:FAD-dependent oxidoreductase [Streptomyces sp. NPDC046261]|uniref:NAD(P)/FAD-dependent oxidoreductase n=1 Tax=Streptomyces sp. NPDC046261 TaxID=3157200 RepID=UPI0033C018FD
MKILLTTADPDLQTSDFLRPGNVIHAPGLHDGPDEDLIDALILHGATALITPRRPADAVLRLWSKSLKGPKFLAYAATPAEPAGPVDSGTEDMDGTDGISAYRYDGPGLEPTGEALRRCERWFTHHRPTAPLLVEEGRRDVVLIGAGIVNLITAVHLADHGYRVTVADRSPAPGSADWRRYGCTHAGDDARMFTLTEMDSYNNRDPHTVGPGYFRAPVEEAGWLAADRRTAPGEERAWIEEFERIPSWLARSYNADVFAFNAEAHDGWQHLRHHHPGLFEDVVLTDGILRLYSDRAHLRAAVARHRALGVDVRELTPGGVARHFPGLVQPMRTGVLVGGFTVPGFTLNVHKFSARIIGHLRERGATFLWNTPVTGVRRDACGRVVAFDCPARLPAGAHVIASPGVHGKALVEGSPCEGRIHGVLGGWIRMSNETVRLKNSLKVARKGHVTEDANVTVAVDADGRDILIVGSGYGYTGADPNAVDDRQLEAMKRGILDTVERLFPGREPLTGSSHPAENYAFKYCVRPWTATSLGIYHAEPTQDGGLFVINGGHNTGGFAQAPAIAHAVLASLQGRPHPMHRLYRPDRFTGFADGDGVAGPPEKEPVTRQLSAN